MDINQFLLALRARRKAFVIALLATIATALAVALIMPKKYVAQSTLLVDARDEQALTPSRGMLSIPMRAAYVATQLELIQSGRVAAQVARELKRAQKPELREAFEKDTGGVGPIDAWIGAQLLQQAQAEVASGGEAEAVAGELARGIHASGGKVPGFGHPLHRPVDPRAERILELADARGVAGPHVLLARRLRDAVAEAWGKPVTMNVSLPIAAVLLDLGFPASAAKSVPILARTAGLLAHLAEERELPLGFHLARAAEEAVEYE
jgi:hypothetical protein